MNMNKEIVARALFAAGQEKMIEELDDTKSITYEVCKAYYLSAFLEALTEIEWVRGRKRAKLVRTGRPHVHDKQYRFAYDMPYDCARPIELQNNEYFIVEDRLILTDDPKAELLYVSNGRVIKPIALARAGTPLDALTPEADMEYFTAGQPWTEPDVTFYPGSPADITDELPQDTVSKDDYAGYVALDYEPKFFEYIEKKIAAKIAVKTTKQPHLHNQMLQESMIIKQEAVDASRAGRAAKVQADPWWGDELGLG